MRRALTWLSILVGLTLIVLSYFVLSAPWGSESVRNSNPRVQFGPTLFVLGVILVFLSAVVYELLPDRRRR